MISKNYKKIAIIDVNKDIQTKNNYNYNPYDIDLNLSFTPKRVFIDMVYVLNGTPNNNTFCLDSELFYEEGKIFQTGFITNFYIENISSNKITIRAWEGREDRTYRVLSVIAIE